ncbi:MAG: response regulator transcription factor [Lachnospiraceae bacterium]|jgi:two-component system response regulator ResD|nr:response regulator transcription factor [Lachnospiraceae bacterium]
MNGKQRILIADDESNIAELISLYLTKEGYETQKAGDGKEAFRMVQSFNPDLIILDIMMPEMDGYEFCREVRKNSTVPIIMLTAKGETFDKVLGLELGADDYMVKPFDTKELVARVKAVLRRLENKESNAKKLSFENLTINLSNYSVSYCGENVEMPPKELELLFYLASHPNQVFTREQLLNQIWGYEYYGDTRTVDVHIKRIREKLGSEEEHTKWSIKTVWGVGYKFEVNA